MDLATDRRQGQNKYETETLEWPNKNSLQRRTETLASRNLHTATNVGSTWSFASSSCKPDR